MTTAYNSGSIMARTLESLKPGTPVYAGRTPVGVVSGVFSEGDGRSADVVVVRWDARGEDVAIPVAEIESVDDSGVQLMRQEADQYRDLAPFDADRFQSMKKLA